MKGFYIKTVQIKENTRRKRKATWTLSIFIAEANKKYNFKYDYSNAKWIDDDTEIEIICKQCHKCFFQKPWCHIKYHKNNSIGCPKCYQSGERNHVWNPDREAVEFKRKMHMNCKAMLSRTLKSLGKTKNNKTEFILGYTRQELAEYIKNHPNWLRCQENKWHIDHVFPIKAFIDHGISNPRIINSLDNLQPLPCRENLSKGHIYDEATFSKWLSAKEEIVGPDELYKSFEIAQEAANAARPPSSKHYGVTKSNKKNISKPWQANIINNGKSLHLGDFACEDDAGKQYDYFSLQFKGIAPNFPDFNYELYVPVEHTRKHRTPKGLSKYKGVNFIKRKGHWVARIVDPFGKRLFLGCFADETDAAFNFDYHAKEMYGEGCYLNFPNKDYSAFIPRNRIFDFKTV